MPPKLHRADGKVRRVGIEIEMGGLSIERVADVLLHTLGGELEHFSEYELFVHHELSGRWAVELDFGLLKARARARRKNGEKSSIVDDTIEQLLRFGAEQIVPVEVVSPPLDMNDIGQCGELIVALREAGALGTSDNTLYAFGIQFNPELPELDAATITAYLQSFLLIYPWLLHQGSPDMTRRLTGFAEPFADDYVRMVLQPSYAPDLAGLIDDYLAANPTRNRALDMLPLFLELDETRVRRKVSDERVKARLTLHYRFPNCEISQEDWGLHVPWKRWLQIESMACDEARRSRAMQAFQAQPHTAPASWFSDWESEIERWLIEL